jgi:hypothetical protein
MDFFRAEVLKLKGLTSYYMPLFIHLKSHHVKLAGFTPYADQECTQQQARNMTREAWGSLRGCRYLLHDRDAKFCPSLSRTDRGKCESPSIASKKPESELAELRVSRSKKNVCRD